MRGSSPVCGRRTSRVDDGPPGRSQFRLSSPPSSGPGSTRHGNPSLGHPDGCSAPSHRSPVTHGHAEEHPDLPRCARRPWRRGDVRVVPPRGPDPVRGARDTPYAIRDIPGRVGPRCRDGPSACKNLDPHPTRSGPRPGPRQPGIRSSRDQVIREVDRDETSPGRMPGGTDRGFAESRRGQAQCTSTKYVLSLRTFLTTDTGTVTVPLTGRYVVPSGPWASMIVQPS